MLAERPRRCEAEVHLGRKEDVWPIRPLSGWSSTVPRRACFEVVADIERYPEWVADLKEVHVHERDEQGRPSLVSFRAGAFGRSTSYTLVYDYSQAPRELRWVQRDGDLTSRLDGIYRFASAPEGGTEVTYQLAVELTGANARLH